MTISSSNGVYAAMEALLGANEASARDNEMALAVLATAAFLQAFGEALSKMKTQADKEAFMQKYLDTHKAGTDGSKLLTTQALLTLDAVQDMLTKSKAYDAQIADLQTKIDQQTKLINSSEAEINGTQSAIDKGYSYWYKHYLSAGSDNTGLAVFIGIVSGGTVAAAAAAAAEAKMVQLQTDNANARLANANAIGQRATYLSQQGKIQATQATLAANMAGDMMTGSSVLSGSANGVLSHSKTIANNCISFLEGIGRASQRS